MKRIIVLPLIALALAVAFRVEAKPSRPTKPAVKKPVLSSRQKPIRLEGGNLFGFGPSHPSAVLAQALTKHPKAEVFVINWNSSATLGTDDCQAHYNRRTRVFELSRFTYTSHSNDELHIETVYRTSEAWKYTGVTDAALKKLAARNTDRYEGDDAVVGYFTQLPKFGCKGRKTKDSSTQTRKKIQQ